MSMISPTTQNFIQIGIGFRFCACVISRTSAQSDSTIFWVLEKSYRRDARTDFDAKYVKRRGSAQGSAFWGSRDVLTPIFQKNTPDDTPLSLEVDVTVRVPGWLASVRI